MELGDRPRKENVFVRRIFDKDTGKSLICRYHPGEEHEQTFGFNGWAKSDISYEEVMRQTEGVIAADLRDFLFRKTKEF